MQLFAPPQARLDSLSQPRKTRSPHARVNATLTRLLSAHLLVTRQTRLQSSMGTLDTPWEDHPLPLAELLVTLMTTTWLQPLVEHYSTAGLEMTFWRTTTLRPV